MSRHAGCSIVVAAAFLGLAAPDAHADGPPLTPSACIAASLNGQKLRAAGTWGAALESLATCADPACPAPIRHDCATWIDEIKAASPTVVLGAQDADGRDLTDVRVTVDDVDMTARINGQAIPIDPGRHIVRYTRPDGATIEQEFVTRDGDKERKLVLSFPRVGAPAMTPPAVAAPLPPPSTAPPEPQSTGRADVIIAVSATIGAAAFLGLGAYFEVHQTSQTDSLTSQCANRACALGTSAYGQLPSEVRTINLNRGLAAGSFGVAAAGLAVAGTFFFARPLSHRGTATATGTLDVRPLPGGAAVGYTRPF